MIQGRRVLQVAGLLVLAAGGSLVAESPDGPGPNLADEPMRAQYSAEAGVQFLDAIASRWQRQEKCFACHSMYAYLVARPMLGGDGTVQQQIRAAAEQAVEQGEWQSQDPNRTAQSVILAAALATHDSRTSGTLHPTTRQVLDRMWTFQREDGSWAWPIRCKWPPSEIDEYFGVALAALAVGMAPGDYRKTPQAVRGLEKIRGYLSRNRAATPYQRGMLLWASRQLDGVLADADEKATVQELLSLQRPDGGWSFASLGNWQRSDGKPQDTTTSDGYGTGFAIYLLRLAGLAEGHSQIQKGIEWLKTHQRQSGRWFTRSANKDNKHYITHEGTAFAMMALAACHQVPGGPQ